MLTSLAKHYKFDVDAPWQKLSAKHQKVILYGSGEETVNFTYVNERGDKFQRSHAFEGVIPNLERRYRDTDSSGVREELAKYLSSQVCPSCNGARLRLEARHVFVDNKTLPELVDMPVGDAHTYFTKLKFTGAKGKIAEKILKELRDRFRF